MKSPVRFHESATSPLANSRGQIRFYFLFCCRIVPSLFRSPGSLARRLTSSDGAEFWGVPREQKRPLIINSRGSRVEWLPTGRAPSRNDTGRRRHTRSGNVHKRSNNAVGARRWQSSLSWMSSLYFLLFFFIKKKLPSFSNLHISVTQLSFYNIF